MMDYLSHATFASLQVGFHNEIDKSPSCFILVLIHTSVLNVDDIFITVCTLHVAAKQTTITD